MEAGVTERDWKPARLIPTGGIRGQEEQESRATSALLAVLLAVPDFGRAILNLLGAPGGRLSTFTEVRLKGADGRLQIPDGALVLEHGASRWSALVETKTGHAVVNPDQVARYLRIAREHDFDGVVTISNQIVADSNTLPYKLNGNKVGKLLVRHISWWQILTEAIIQHRFRGVDDPDQAWILDQLIRYLTDERSGAGGFEGMGEGWVRVRDGARNGTLRPPDPDARTIAARWEELIEFLCLGLSQELGVAVRRQRSRGRSPADRLGDAARLLADEGVLRSGFKVPHAVGPIEIAANLQSGQVTTSVEIEAPTDLKRPTARINWLLRQLRDAPDDLRLDVRFARLRESQSELLGSCRGEPSRLVCSADPKREPRSFTLAATQSMGRKAGKGEGSFVAEISKQAISFYRDLVQDLRPPQPKAPQLAHDAKEKSQAPSAGDEGQVRRETHSGLRNIAELTRHVASIQPIDNH